jgi:hypothetical protein
MEKLPAATRVSSSWFNWFAVLPAIADGGCSLIPTWCVEARACRCAGGSADVVAPGPGAIPGGIPAGGCAAAGGAYPGAPGPGRLESGEEGPSPPGGVTAGPVPVVAPGPGPVRCAQTGAAKASAATIATPLKRCFMTLILRCSSGLAKGYPMLIVRDLLSGEARRPEEGGYAPLFRFSGFRHDGRAGYWVPLARRAARPGPTSGLEAEGSGPGGGGGGVKLPDATRASSSWFSWFAVLPVISDGGCAAIPAWCVEARACRCAGGSADVVAPGTGTPGTAPETAPAGDPGYPDCGVPGMPGDPAGRLYSGDEGPGPPGGLTAGPVPVGAVAPGPVRCAQTGAANASAATIATPLKRCFMTLILRCSSGLAKGYPTLILRYSARHALTMHAPFCSGNTR